MNNKNSDKITEAAPSLFSNGYGVFGEITKDSEEKYPFYFECGDGWVDIIYDAAVKLEAYIQTLPEDVRSDVVALQVKEKFGTLRFYVSYYTEDIEAIIKEAEQKSATTCETCGNPGKLRGRMWRYTACDEHTRQEDLQEVSQEDLP